jgi:hypothetical protein
MSNGQIDQVVENPIQQPGIVKVFAHIFSYIFHPLFIPVYITWFLTKVHPSYFSGFSDYQKNWLILRVAYSMVFFPLITVLLLKALKFIDSFFLHTQKDRIIPYIACGIFFFWVYLVFRNQPNIPTVLTAFIFAVFLASSAALLANIYLKISMHAIGMGGVLGILLVVMASNTMLTTLPFSIAFLLTGLVCTSRLIVSNHQPKEIYLGLLLGIVSQIIGAAVIG